MSNPLSTFVKTQRKLLKLSQEELAFKAGVELRFLRELEPRKQTVRLDKVNQVLELFGKKVGMTNLEDRGHLDNMIMVTGLLTRIFVTFGENLSDKITILNLSLKYPFAQSKIVIIKEL